MLHLQIGDEQTPCFGGRHGQLGEGSRTQCKQAGREPSPITFMSLLRQEGSRAGRSRAMTQTKHFRPFACVSCSGEWIVFPERLDERAVLRCARCGSILGTWQAFKEGARRLICAEIASGQTPLERASSDFTVDQLRQSIHSHPGGSCGRTARESEQRLG